MLVGQVIVNSVIVVSQLLLVSISFYVIYRTLRIFHFAHAGLYAFSPYLLYTFHNILGLNLVGSILGALIGVCLLAYLLNHFIHRHLREKKASTLVHLIASMGAYLIIQNMISIMWGDDTKAIITCTPTTYSLGDAYFTTIHTLIVVISITLTVATVMILKYTKYGMQITAVGENSDLSSNLGIHPERVYTLAFIFSACVAGIAGILIGIDTNLVPTMGFHPLMMAVIIVVVGGVGSIRGVIIATIGIVTIQNVATYFIASQWQDLIAFGVMLLFLIIKPEGVSGKPVQDLKV